MLIPQQRRKQVADDGARASLELDRDSHAGREVDEIVVDLHLGAVKRHPRGVDKLLSPRLAGRSGGRRVVLPAVLRLVAGDGVLGQADHFAADQAVVGEIECVDLDLGILPDVYKADVAVIGVRNRALLPKNGSGARV